MTRIEGLLGVAGVALAIGAVADRTRLRHAAGIAAALLALAAWWLSAAPLLIGAIAAALAAAHLLGLALPLIARARPRFTDEERAIRRTSLHGLDARQARHLLDQGMWIDGKAGEVLIRESAPVTHLFHLSNGAAEITSGGTWVATTSAPTFLGEITVLDETGATATATLLSDSRFWCVPASKLRTFLKENPAIRVALERSFLGPLAAKLRAANLAIAGGPAR